MQEDTQADFVIDTPVGEIKGKVKVHRNQNETTQTSYSFQPPALVQWATNPSTWALGGGGAMAGILGLFAAWSQRKKRTQEVTALTAAQQAQVDKHNKAMQDQIDTSVRQAGEIVAGVGIYMREADPANLKQLKTALKSEMSKDTRLLVAELR